MVKRSYSRLAYAAPIVVGIGLVATVLPLTALTLTTPGECDGACAQIRWLQVLDAALNLGLALLVGLWGWYTRRISLRKDRRRQAAARGEGATIPLSDILLGDDHPPLMLLLPVTIRLTMAWRDWLIAMGGALLILGCIVASVALAAYRPDPGQYPTAVVLALCEVAVLAFLALLTAAVALTARETLVVTPDGLRGRRHGLPQLVRWQDARLFARLDDLHFELASPTAIVRFTRLDQIRGQRPTIPFADYRLQADALLLLIAERTGLPLADLRSPAQSALSPRTWPTPRGENS